MPATRYPIGLFMRLIYGNRRGANESPAFQNTQRAPGNTGFESHAPHEVGFFKLVEDCFHLVFWVVSPGESWGARQKSHQHTPAMHPIHGRYPKLVQLNNHCECDACGSMWTTVRKVTKALCTGISGKNLGIHQGGKKSYSMYWNFEDCDSCT